MTPHPRHAARFHRLLGTVVEVVVDADDDQIAESAIGMIADEIARLERLFTMYDDASEFRRWQRGEVSPGVELAAVLRMAADWFHRTAGGFNPAVAAMTALWDAAAAENHMPDDVVVADTVASIARLSFDPETLTIRAGGPPLSLNAIAKGWIVDRAFERGVSMPGVRGVTVSAGGDLRHGGRRPVSVGLENPARPYDNEPALTSVSVAEGALATSGDRRKGWTIGDSWLGHVIDPRTGRPVGHISSASVIAPTAATADVVATALMVWRADEGIEFVETTDGVECLVVGADGSSWCSSGWPVVS